MVPTLVDEPVLPAEELPWVDPDEPKIGAIAGTVIDEAAEPMVGVTIVVSTEGMMTQTAITDEEGTFVIEDLPPGDYVVTFYYIETTIERTTHVEDELVELRQKILYEPGPETIVIGCGGMSMENTYEVDGIDTTGLTFDE